MMSILFLTTVASSAVSRAAAPQPRLGIAATETLGMDRAAVARFLQTLGSGLAERGITVGGSAQAVAPSCTEDLSCLAALARDIDHVLVVSLLRVASLIELHLRLVRLADG